MKTNTSRRLTIALIVAASFIMLLALPALADDGPVTSYTDLVANPDGEVQLGEAGVLQPTSGGLAVYTDRVAFAGATSVQLDEDFASSPVAPNAVCSDAAPWTSATNGACYATGDLIDGFSATFVDTGGSMLNVLLTTGFLGTPCDAIGPNTFADDWAFDITDPAIYAVGFDVMGDLATPVNINIDVYGASGLIGSSSSVGSAGGTFWGAVANEPITRIETSDGAGGGELFCNLVMARRVPTDVAMTSFGGSSQSALPFVALILVAILAVGGLAYRRIAE